jgi:RNA polymerase sigma factor (sigma-70 family)
MQQHLIETFSQFYNQTEDYLFNKERQAILTKALDNLTPQRREIFKLCKIEGRSYKEVAEMLSISPSTVSNQLVSATKTVKDYVFFHSGDLFMLYLAAVFVS